MEVCESETIHSELVDVRRTNLSSEARQVTEAQIVCHNDEEVWTLPCAIGRSHDGQLCLL